MIVNVTDVRVKAGETVAVAHGFAEDGSQVRFAGDWRPMVTIAEALSAGEEVIVDVEPWQVV